MHTLRESYFSPPPTFLHSCSWSQRAAASRWTTAVSASFCELATPVWLAGVPVTGGPWFAPPHANRSPVVVSESPLVVLKMFMVAQSTHLSCRPALQGGSRRR